MGKGVNIGDEGNGHGGDDSFTGDLGMYLAKLGR